MSLSVKEKIDPTDIADVVMLKKHKVFLLVGHEGERIILKSEGGTTVEQVKSAKAVVKAIDPTVKMKIVSKEELEGVLDFINEFLRLELVAEDLNGALKNLKRETLEELKEVLEESIATYDSGRDPLLKLNFMEVKELGGELDKRLAAEDADKGGIRAFVKALNKTGGFEQLGKIVVADLLNFNDDRFFPDGGLKYERKGTKIEFKAIVNIGNIFIDMTNPRQGTLSALDFLAPTSQSKDINAALADDHPVRILVNKAKRDKYAADIVSDLDAVVRPKKSRFSFRKLDSNATKRLIAGMVEGAGQIAAALETKYKNKPEKGNRWTEGVKERYEVLIAASKVR